MSLHCCLNTLQTPAATAVVASEGSESIIGSVSQLPTYRLCHAPALPPPIQLKQTKPVNDKFFTQTNASRILCVRCCLLMSANMQVYNGCSFQVIPSWFSVAPVWRSSLLPFQTLRPTKRNEITIISVIGRYRGGIHFML